MDRPFPAYKGDEPYIFVSYSHADSELVFQGIRLLHNQGYNIWYDDGINPGASWREEVAEAILGCDLFIVLVSPRSANSEDCLKEVNYALEHKRALLAIHTEPTQLSPGLELALNDRQAIFRYELTQEQYREKILAGVGGHIQQSSSFAPTVPTVNANKKSWPILVGAGVVALAILAVGLLLYTKPSGEIGDSKPSTSTEAQSEAAVPETSVEIESEILHNSIAVLPFANLSPDPDNAYFAAGVHEEILNQLAKIKDLSVIARTTMVRYAESNLSIPEIAAELNVEAIMEGSVRYANNRVRITAQLNDAKSGVHLWSETYDRDFEDIFAIQSDIAVQITNAMKAEYELEEQDRIGRRATDNTEAYSHYLLALSRWGSFADTGPVHEALDAAIALDPEFALALAFKAWIHAVESAFGFNFFGPGFTKEDQERFIKLAEQVAKQALDVDDKQALAHYAMGFVHWHDRKWQAAIESFELTYRLNPNDYKTTNVAGAARSLRGDLNGAIRLLELSVKLNPADFANIWNVSMQMYYLEHWENSRQQASLLTRLVPEAATGYATLALANSRIGDVNAVRANAALAEARNPGILEYQSLAQAFSQIGDDEEARRIYDLAGAGNESLIPNLEWQFWMHLSVKRYDAAIDYLERAIQTNFPSGTSLRLRINPDHPDFDPIRSLPKFDDLVRQVETPLT